MVLRIIEAARSAAKIGSKVNVGDAYELRGARE